MPKPDKAEPEQPQRCKPRRKTIDAANTLATAGTSAKQAEPEPEPASHRGCVAAAEPPLPHARAPDPQLDLDPIMSVA